MAAALAWYPHLDSRAIEATPEPAPVQLAIEPRAEVLEAIELHRVTAYNPLPYQTDEDPYTSSCGPNRPDQIAVSRDLFFDEHGRKHLCGVEVTLIVYDSDGQVEAILNRVIWDTMNPRYNLTADVYLDHHDVDEALAWGVKRGALVMTKRL